MRQVFLNYNGNIFTEDTPLFSANHSFFRYGNSLYETMLWQNGNIRFLDYHIDRLKKSMKILAFSDPSEVDAFFIKSKAEELIRKNHMVGQSVQIRLTIFRGEEGGFNPGNNKMNYLFQIDHMLGQKRTVKRGLIVDLFTDVKKDISDISRLKMNNVLVHALAEGYKQERQVDEVLLLNNNGALCEAISSNIFVFYKDKLYTPAINQGCVEGVMRKIVMEMGEEEDIEVVEAEIDPDIMGVADEIFCTNAVQGIQWVLGFKRKRYFNRISKLFQQKLQAKDKALREVME
ncbi:MAG TPA: aminotransferase class IV [Sphingobacterium sp.]|nr:aminotransferase class IV [Sphingobacterium sp.]